MKKTAKFVWIVVGLMIVLGLIGFGTQNTFNGGTITGVTKDANFVSSSQDTNGTSAYLIDVVVNKGGESLVAEITPEDLASYGITQVPDGTIKVYFDLQNVTCNYDIIADDLTIYKLYQATVRKSLCGGRCTDGCSYASSCPWNEINLDTVKKNCQGTWFVNGVHNPEFCGKVFAPTGTGTENAAPGAPVAGGNCNDIIDIQKTPMRPELGMQASEWCYQSSAEIMDGFDGDHWQVTHVGGIPWFTGYKIGNVPSPQFSVEITIENSNGSKVSTVLTNKETSKFLQDVGKAKWVGNLQAQQLCGTPSVDYAVVKDLMNNGTMKVIDKSLYDQTKAKQFELQNYDNNNFGRVGTDPGMSGDVLQDKISTLNSLHRNIYAQSVKNNCKIVGMQYVCSPTEDIIYPELQLTLKASWVGIVEPNGAPHITNVVVPSKVYDGEMSFVQVDLENIGKEVDSFDVAIDCKNNIGIGSVRTSLAAGEKGYANLFFTSLPGTYNCKAIAYSVNNPMARDEKSFTLNVIERDVPKPNTCESVPKQPCAEALWQADPICSWNTQFCEKKTDYTIYYMIAAALIVLAIVGYYLTRKNSGRRRKRRK